jgi:hypothetical protein
MTMRFALLFKSVVIFVLLFKSSGCGSDEKSKPVDAAVLDAITHPSDATVTIDAAWVTCMDCIVNSTLAECVPRLTVEHCIGSGPDIGCTPDSPTFNTCGQCVERYSLAVCYPVHLAQ